MESSGGCTVGLRFHLTTVLGACVPRLIGSLSPTRAFQLPVPACSLLPDSSPGTPIDQRSMSLEHRTIRELTVATVATMSSDSNGSSHYWQRQDDMIFPLWQQ